MSNTYKSGSHNKYLLQYHLIFVCKYRRKLLSSPNIASDIKGLSIEYCQKHNVIIHYMETDKDHIHYMIETTPNINLSNMVRTMKNITILELRKQTGLSQSQFAKEFHIQLKTLQSWEQGWRNTPECILYMVQKILELEERK